MHMAFYMRTQRDLLLQLSFNIWTVRLQIDNKVKSPCIGVCSTGIGDSVCRGCKRFSHEIINWNAYSESERLAISGRLHVLLEQVVSGKIVVHDADKLKQELAYQKIPFNENAPPQCWVHDLLKAGASQIDDLAHYGCKLLPEWEGKSFVDIKNAIDNDFFILSQVHYERYFKN